MRKKKRQREEKAPKRRGTVPYEVRIRIVQAVLRGMKQADVAVGFGISVAAVQKFLRMFEAGGAEALRPGRYGVSDVVEEEPSERPAPQREAIALKEEHPDWGTRRIRDVLARFEGLGISETTVRRVLHEEGLLVDAPPPAERTHPPRRFERAEPNQLWQSDIFTFELRRNQRLYVAAFMDDHSRYLVSWTMAHHQKSSLVVEAIERGIAEYGEPREVLTDQGRQYTAWRGETEFEQLLRRYGIAHVKSRPQHPQTLGKIERFWKTLWDEFLGRTVFADFADCQRRIGLFVQHYNFQRPHQALDGLVPADRFFRAAPHVRAAVEAQVTANALRLAQEKPPQKPFYLVGRLGDQDLSIAATGGALQVQLGEASQRIPLPKEDEDETQSSRQFHPEDETAEPTRDATTADATLADRPPGPRRGGAAALSDGPLGAVGRAAGDGGDRGAPDLSRVLLPARGEGAQRDAGGAGAGRGGVAGGEPGGADRRAREQGGEAGAGAPAAGAAAVPDAQDRARGPGGDGGARPPPQAAQLGAGWARTFALLEEDDGGDVTAGLDADADYWCDDAVSWRRKLAGADAPTDREGEEVDDGTTEAAGRTGELPGQAERASGANGAVRPRDEGTRRAAHDDRRGRAARDRAGEHADARAPGGAGGAGGADPAAERADAEAGRAGRAGSGGEAAPREGAQARGAADLDGPDARRGWRDHPQLAWATAATLDRILADLEDGGEPSDTVERRGSRASSSCDRRDPRASDDDA